jgi:hypothetical protein
MRKRLGALLAAAAMFTAAVAVPAAPASAGNATPAVGIQYWGVYGQYPDRYSCIDVGTYLASAGWYYNYSCARQPDGWWYLWVLE